MTDGRRKYRMDDDPRYVRAMAEYDARMGDSLKRARSWRIAAVLALACTFGEGALLAWQLGQADIATYIVEVDGRTGQVLGLDEVAEARQTPTDAMIRHFLGRWIEDVRGMPTDPVVLRTNLERAYSFVTQRGERLLDMELGRPEERLGEVAVGVSVDTVMSLHDDQTYQITWAEQVVDLGTGVTTEQRWSAIVTIVIEPPESRDGLIANPLGIYVDAVTISQNNTGEER